MPGKVKVKIISGKNLPVMDRSSDTTDAYVEVKLGTTTYKTDVCRKSLNPQWNSEWYRFEVDDSELQDEPLQIRVMDHDTYSANDSIGKVYLDLNPLLLSSGGVLPKLGWNVESSGNNEHVTNSVMSGWIPVYDTMHGIRGEINVVVKVELFSDFNKFRQSSCGVQFFCSPMIPHGYCAQTINGFVEELVVNDDPEYQWIDKIRTPRASNEARQTLFFKLSGELQRKIGVKALELGGNAVVGYSQCFDLEGESGVVARGIGTSVTLIKLKDTPTTNATEATNEERALNYLQFLRYNSGFYLNRDNCRNPFQSIPSLNTSALYSQKINSDTSEGSSTIAKRNFTRHLSYSDFSPSKSTLSLNRTHTENIHHASSVQTLLKQEELRGNPKTGLSQRIKNLKYSSQSMLSKKMTALKARLSESGMPEESDLSGSLSSIPSITPPSKKKKSALFKKSTNTSNIMAEMLVRSLMYTGLDKISENHDSPSSSSSPKTETNIELRDVEENASKSLDNLNKSISEPDFNLFPLNDDSSSDSSTSDDDEDEDEDEDEDTQDEPNLCFDTVSNIIKNIEITYSETPSTECLITSKKPTPLYTEIVTGDDSLNNEYVAYRKQLPNIETIGDVPPLAKAENFVIGDSPIQFLLDNDSSDVIYSTNYLSQYLGNRSANCEQEKVQPVMPDVEINTENQITSNKLNILDTYTCPTNSEVASKIITAPENVSSNSPPSNPLLIDSNQNTDSTNESPSCLNTMSSKMPGNLELVQGNNNMHASLAHSPRASVGSPVTEPIRNDYGHQRTESFGGKVTQSPARFQPIPFMHRRSSDSDLSITPKGNSLTGSDKSCGLQSSYFSRAGTVLRTTVPQDNFDMLEYPFLTMSKYPTGCIVYLGGVVSARSVKLLERITNIEEPESRDTWWTEIRMEIRSHARTLNCNAVLGYSETTTLCEDVCVLSASGTAAVIGFHCNGDLNDFVGGTSATPKPCYVNKDVASSLDNTDVEREKTVQSKLDSTLWTNDANVKSATESPEHDQQPTSANSSTACTICHLPYTGNSVPMRAAALKCSLCRTGKVPDVILATIEMPEGIPNVGRGCFVQAYVCRQLKDLRSESSAKDISDGLPFLEYELHRILVNKIKIKGMNAVFGLKVEISIGVKMLVGIATGTAIFLLPLPPPPIPKLVSDRSVNDKEIAELQRLLHDTVKTNKEIYQYKVSDDSPQNGRVSPENDTTENEQPLLDLSAENRDCCILEVDDPEDMEIMNLLVEPRPPDGFHVVNTELVPGLDELEIVKNLQMFTQIWRAKLQTPYNLGKHIHKLLQSVYFKLRRMIPCALCDLQFKIELPESDEIQLSVLGMALGLGVLQNPGKCIKKNVQDPLKDSAKGNEEEMIFNLEDDNLESNIQLQQQCSTLLNVQNAKQRTKSPQRSKMINVKQHLPYRERHGVDITPLSYVPGGKIERYLGNLSFFFIRETTSVREEGGVSGFVHSFITEVLAIVRAHISALGGNAMVAYYMTECVLSHSVHKNQGQCLINVGGDVVFVSYFKEE